MKWNGNYDAWVRFVFNRPYIPGRSWWWDYLEDFPDLDSATAIRFMTRLFTTTSISLHGYSRGQMGEGLWYIVGDGCSGWPVALTDPHVPWSQREKCLRSIVLLFSGFFFAYCPDTTGAEADRLRTTCFMWWELFPPAWTASEGDDAADIERLNAVTLEVLEAILRIRSATCQQAALHGLGHVTCYRGMHEKRDQVAAVIDRNMDRIHPSLHYYACQAREGQVQ